MSKHGVEKIGEMSFSIYFQKINVIITADQSFIVAYANLLKNWFYFWFKGVYIASAVIVPGRFVYITNNYFILKTAVV